MNTLTPDQPLVAYPLDGGPTAWYDPERGKLLPRVAGGAFDDVIDRDDVTDGNTPGGLIPEDAAGEIIKEMPQASAIMQLARRLPNLSRKQRRLPVISALPDAQFVDGDTGLKSTTDAAWKDAFLNVEEIAVIVPIPENVIDDSAYPIWDEVRPYMIEAVGMRFDRAVIFGENKPASWPDGLLTQIADAGHAVAEGSVGDDLFDELLTEGGVLNLVEEDGYMPTGHLAALRMKARMRSLRDDQGRPLFGQTLEGPFRYSLDGEPLVFPRNGSIDADQVSLISGDWSRLVWAVRQDITWKLITEGVITNADNEIVFNLPQQDMVALRLKFRVAWTTPNPPNRVNPDEDTRFAFASLVPADSEYAGS
jgi:HK97 family phage major capsid protein